MKFMYRDYAELATRIRIFSDLGKDEALGETLANNLNLIVSALDIASGADERIARLTAGIDEEESGL